MRLTKLLSEIQVSGGKRIVYATSDYDGHFDELIILNSHQIISDDNEDDNGVYECIYKTGKSKDSFFYVAKLEI